MASPASRFFSTRIVRRLLGLFVACAILPILAISAGTLDHVSDELEEQALERLQHSSKSAGMHLVAGLLTLRSWADVGAALAGDTALGDEIGGHVRRVFRSVAILPGDGADPRSVFGEPPPTPEPSRDVRAHLARGRSWVTTVADPDGGRPAILLVHPLEADTDEGPMLIGEIDPEPLFHGTLTAILPNGSRFWVLDEAGHTLHASAGIGDRAPAAFERAVQQASSGSLVWEAPDGTWMGGYWSAFIKPQLGTPYWTVVVAQPRSLVLAPIATFRTIFPLAAGLCLAVVSLAVLLQLRRWMAPLAELTDAAHRVAKRDFDVRVRVESGDEFEHLARSFNDMADRLDEHFESLARLIEIDRSLLASRDERQIVATLTSGIRRLSGCGRVAVMLEESDRPGAMWLTVDPQGLHTKADTLSADQTALLLGMEGALTTSTRDPAWRCLAPLAAMGIDRVLVLPILVDRHPIGLIAADLGGDSLPSEREVLVRQLADQASAALTNARTAEHNRRLAHFDSLTGLPNRELFGERLHQALLRVRRPGDRVGVGLLDIDGFKRINDTLGHGAGDELICQVARRIARVLREGTLARMGGDEFTFIIGDLPDADVLARAAQRLLDVLDEPFEIDGREVFVTASIGLAVSPDDGAENESLLRNADAAMYYAKSKTGSSFRFYDSSMNEVALQHMELEYEVRRAIERDEFRVHYQPIVETHTREIIGVEALVRWQHPRRGLVGPDDFVPLAEESGLIVDLGEKVLWTACRELRSLLDEGLGPVRLSVNLSVRQLADPDVVDRVRRALQSSGWPASQLVLEITESMLMSPDRETAAVLRILRGLGVALSIDDFGSGYSSLSYLKNFEVDHLKIDRVFVSDLEYDRDNAEITAAILAMAHGLGLGVVAEGVQTEAQLEYLRELDCDWVQGFLFSVPIPVDALRKLLREQAEA